MFRRTWTFGEVLSAVATVLSIVAFGVAVGWWFSNWEAWISAALAFLTAAHWVDRPARQV